MKIIHTADWHIGKYVNEFFMLEDQAYYFDKFINFLRQEKPDALIIAGDIYDRSVPPADAVELLDNIFKTITLDLKIPILAIAGNHDSCERIDYGSRLFQYNNLYIEGMIKEKIKKISLKDNEGNVNFYLLPYAAPSVVRNLYKDTEIKNHEDAMTKILDKINETIDNSERNILIAHGYVTFLKEDKENKGGLQISESERPLSIGGTDLIDANMFNNFNYVALGHLHAPQKVGSDKIRYSGSPLKYSVSESKQKKSVTVVHIDDKGDVSIELREIESLRDMRVIKGTLEELTDLELQKNEKRDDYVFIELADEGEMLDAISKIRSVYPNVMGLRRINNNRVEEVSMTAATGNFREKSMLHLFSEFYNSMVGTELTEEKEDLIKSLLDDIEEVI